MQFVALWAAEIVRLGRAGLFPDYLVILYVKTVNFLGRYILSAEDCKLKEYKTDSAALFSALVA